MVELITSERFVQDNHIMAHVVCKLRQLQDIVDLLFRQTNWAPVITISKPV